MSVLYHIAQCVSNARLAAKAGRYSSFPYSIGNHVR